jgi:hypothetical protein
VNAWPAIVAVSVLGTPVFSVQDTVTEPGPEPLVGETVSQEPFPDAVQVPPAQPAGRPVRVTSCEPAWESGFAELGVIVKLVHVGGATSSFVIVPTPWASPIEAPDAFVRLTENVSLASIAVSPFTVTLKGWDVTPGPKVSVCASAT